MINKKKVNQIWWSDLWICDSKRRHVGVWIFHGSFIRISRYRCCLLENSQSALLRKANVWLFDLPSCEMDTLNPGAQFFNNFLPPNSNGRPQKVSHVDPVRTISIRIARPRDCKPVWWAKRRRFQYLRTPGVLLHKSLTQSFSFFFSLSSVKLRARFLHVLLSHFFSLQLPELT